MAFSGVYQELVPGARLVYTQIFEPMREAGEGRIRASGIPATVLRPWYVLGPGHRWPYALPPIYQLMERVPSARESARRLGLVTLKQMVNALVHAVEHPPAASRIVEVPEIRACSVFPEPHTRINTPVAG